MIDDILFDVKMVYKISAGETGGAIREYVIGGDWEFDFVGYRKESYS